MNKIPFQEYHLFQILKLYGENPFPLDHIIADYFRANKALGSKDRAFIANTAYGIVRWKGLLEYLTNSQDNWKLMFECYQSINIDDLLKNEKIPLNIRYSFPSIIFDALLNAYGLKKTLELCLNSNDQAPATIRVNTIKISRAALMEKWSKDYDIRPCEFSENGIIFNKKINFFATPEFKQGFFEVQDEGSQLIADLVDAKPGDMVLDYCAGAGGKSLAIAPKMEQMGQLYLHDIRKKALMEAKQRLKRAGIQNAQIIHFDAPHLKKIKKKFDWVLVDAPCSGTGTLRRNPDMKWRFDEETIPKLIGMQRTIFERALSYLKPEGHIVYATCSLLKEENQDQMNFFIQAHGLIVMREPFQSFPCQGGMDGFFSVVLKKA